VKTYTGDRTIDGIVVTVDGLPLEQFVNIKEFSDQGFEWAYDGDEPQQLALALLVDHGVDPERATKLSGRYMKMVTSKLENTWTLTSADIDATLAIID